MKKKVLLITPPYHSGVVESAGAWLPLGLVYVAGSLRQAGHEVAIYDAMSKWHGYQEIEDVLKAFQPDVIAMGSITACINETLKVFRLARNLFPQVMTILGNTHPTFCWEELLLNNHHIVDFIVRGEGEITTSELLECVNCRDNPRKVRGLAFWQNGGPIVTSPRPFISDLDALPAAWDLLNWKDYFYRPKAGSTLAVVSSSRGCTQKCSFCSQQLFWQQQWRARSPESFVRELEMLRDRFGVNVAMIADETPTYDRTRWKGILDLLRERKVGVELLMETRVDDIIRDSDLMDDYARAGIVHIYVGVESTRQEQLDMFCKEARVEASKKAIDLINATGLISETSFVLGMPDETPEKIRETVELARHYGPDMAFFLAIAPWPYADLYPLLKPYIEVFDYSRYNLVEPVVKPVNMTLEELDQELGRAARDFYMDKFTNLEKLSPQKKDFMISVCRILAEHSYLGSKMKGQSGSTSGMPLEIQRILNI